jgi:hypothetical protein
MRHRGWAVSLISGFLVAGTAYFPSSSALAKQIYVAHARDQRFCELDLITGKPPNLTAAVYTTLGSNDCLQGKFDALDAKALAKQFQVDTVLFNMPRHLVMSMMWLYDAGERKNFSGLRARWVGTFQLTGAELSGSKWFPAYAPREIKLHSEFLYRNGTKVFLIVQPDGKRWVMQTYTRTIDPTLTLSALPDLGAKFKNLPSGWEFMVKTLDQDLTIAPPEKGHIAHIIADEFDNTYEGCGFDAACNYAP